MNDDVRAGVARLWWLVPVGIIVGLFVLRAAVHVDPRARLAPSSTRAGDPPYVRASEGSLYVARGGPLIVGFQSDSPARLMVGAVASSADGDERAHVGGERGGDDRERANGVSRDIMGQGVRTERIIVPAGPLAIRFAGARDARLVWSPVGRRGDPEYVPASSVSPEPPERATFASPGTDIADGLIALALLVTLVTSLLYVTRARLARVPRALWIAMGAVLAVALVARLVDLGGAGQTWDEDVNWAAGRNYVSNLLSLDFSARAWRWNFEHPPVMKLLDGIGAQLADGFGPARALSALWSALACALLVPIGARLYNRRTGVLAGLVAALLPSLVAHGQIIGHESPTILWWALGVLLALCAHDGLDERDGLRALRLRLAAIGVVVGIAVASRFVNGLLGPLCVAIVVVNAPAVWRRATLAWLPLMVVTTVVTFYVVWPRLWPGPIDALRASLAKLDTTHAPEPFLGAITAKPAASYFLVYLAATLPAGVLAASALGLVRAAVDRTRASLVLVAWLVLPLAVALSPVRQDGVRYVMPCVLALALLAAAGVDFALRRVRLARVFTAASTALALYLAVTLARVHPYYLDYFGEQVGGPRQVAARHWFETAWWGEGVDRAVAYVNANAAPGARVYRDCILPAHLAWFREDLWSTLVRRADDADWIVEYVSPAATCRVPADATQVFEVDALGAPLARVYRRP